MSFFNLLSFEAVEAENTTRFRKELEKLMGGRSVLRSEVE